MAPYTSMAYWIPRRLMVLAVILHLIAMPLVVTRDTSWGSLGRLSSSDSGSGYDVMSGSYSSVTFGGSGPKTGFQQNPAGVFVLGFLLFIFGSYIHKSPFWQRRRGYWLGVILLLVAGPGAITTLGGKFVIASLVVGIIAAWRRSAEVAREKATLAAN
jgi:hypothetical protein